MTTTFPGPVPVARSANGGDQFRAQLRDLDWVRGAGPVELRHAIHALCWRMHRSTVDALCSDPVVADKVLSCARGVKRELDAKITELNDELDDKYQYGRPSEELQAQFDSQRQSLRRRRGQAEKIIAATSAATDMHSGSATLREEQMLGAAAELGRAIAGHRDQVHPDEACDADQDLWRVLDQVRVPAHGSGTQTVAQLLERLGASATRQRPRRHAA